MAEKRSCKNDRFRNSVKSI